MAILSLSRSREGDFFWPDFFNITFENHWYTARHYIIKQTRAIKQYEACYPY